MKRRLRDLESATAAIKPFLEQYLQEHGIDTSKNFVCINPKHPDTNASMTIKQDPQHAYCFGCGTIVDIFTAATFLEGKPGKGKLWIEENVLYLANKYNVQLEMTDLTEDEIYEYRTYKAYDLAARLVSDPNFGDYSAVDKEIEIRGWDKNRIAGWGIGTVNYKDFKEVMKENGFEPSFLSTIDLDRSNLFNEDNLLFTVYDEFGSPVGFSARNVKFNKEDPNSRKYINTKTTGLQCNIFKKGERLYGFDIAKDAGSPLYLFEGQADVTTARHHGIMNCCCTMGTALTDYHISLLKRHGMFNIVLVLDADTAGEKAVQKIMDEKFAPNKEFKIRLIHLPNGMDPDELLRTKGAEEFARLKRWDAFEWRLNQFPEDEDPEEICSKMLPIILSEKNHIRHEKMAKILKVRTGLEFSTIMSEIKRMRSEKDANLAERKTAIIEDALYKTKRNPEESELVLTEAMALVRDVEKKFGSDSMGISTTLDFVLSQKEIDEKKTGEFAGFYLKPEGLGGIGARLNDNWRTDHWICIGGIPQSGKCQKFDTLIPIPTGEYKTIEELVKIRQTEVLGMDENKRIVPMKVNDWINSGELECFSVTTLHGIKTEPSETHPYYTLNGWKQVKDLKVGDKIAIAKNYNCFDNLRSPISEEEAIVLAGLIAEGSITKSVGFSNIDNELLELFTNSAEKLWPGISFRDNKQNTIYIVDKNNGKPNRTVEYLKEKNLFGKNSHTKFIPDDIFKCSPKRIAKFIGMLWACDGWIYHNNEKGNKFEIGITFCNYKLIKQLRSLLLRFNINTSIRYSKKSYNSEKQFNAYTLSIRDIEGVIKFYNNIKIPIVRKQIKLEQIVHSIKNNISAYTNNLPSELWDRIKQDCNNIGITLNTLFKIMGEDRNSFGYDKEKDRFKEFSSWTNHNSRDCSKNKNITPRKLKLIGYILQDKFLIDIAEGDIYFDEITEIKSIGKHQCYDLSIDHVDHNFIAEDTVVHNSSLCAQLAYEIASDERNNATVIYHSIDDAARFILFKMVANAANDIRLKLGHIANPNYWLSQPGYDYIHQLRERGYNDIINLIKDQRLVLKDATENTSLSYAENLLRYYREIHPDRNIVLVIDNFHKLPDYAEKQGQERVKTLSNHVKNLSTTYKSTLITTVEYKKIYDESMPKNSDIADSRAIEYDSTCVLHLHNDLHVKGPYRAMLVHEHNGETLPRIRVGFGKNKISGYEGREFLDFYPASATMRAVDLETAKQDQRIREEQLKEFSKRGGQAV
jgi:replicative DNA helicase